MDKWYTDLAMVTFMYSASLCMLGILMGFVNELIFNR